MNNEEVLAEPVGEPNEEIEAAIACLGDDASALRDETGDPEDERAANMDRAADLLRALASPQSPALREVLAEVKAAWPYPGGMALTDAQRVALKRVDAALAVAAAESPK